MEFTKMKIRFIQHSKYVNPGEYLLWANRHGYEVSFTRIYNYEKLPDQVDADMLIILGGPQNPGTTKAEYDYYDVEAEKDFINLYISRGRIVVGSCLGAQLMGDALGGNFHLSPYPEIGYVRGTLTEEGRKDPLFKDFPDHFDMGSWHFYMPGLNHNCEVLAYSDGCPHQIIRFDKYAYGFQAHMEMNKELAKAILDSEKEEPKITGPYIRSEEEILSHDYTEMNKLLSSFLDNIVNSYNEKK